MQGRRSASGSFPEIVDLDEGQVSNNTSMSQQHTGFNNMLNPVKSRLSNCTVSSGEAAHRTDDIEPSGHSFRGWSSGESSTRVNQQTDDVIKLEHGQSSSFGAFGGPVYNSSRVEGEHVPTGGTSRDDNSGISSGFMAEENNNNDPGSAGGWGLSCKRKSLEGSSAMSYEGGSSSFFPQAESAWTDPARNNASSSSNLPTYPWNPSSINPPGQLNPRTGVDVRGTVSESSLRNPGRRGHHQESLPLNLSSGGSRRFNIWSQRPASFSDSQDLRPTASRTANSSASQIRSHTISRNMLAFPWNGVNNSTSGNFGERVTVWQDEGNSRSIQMNDAERLIPRNMARDAASWSVASSGRISTPGLLPSTIRDGVSSNIHPSLPTPNWVPYPSPSTHSQQTLWSSIPSIETESGGHGSQYPTFSSSQEAVMSSGSSSSQGHRRHPHARSGFLMERQGGGIHGMPHSLRALAADIEGRSQLISEIRQALSAMRRGENLPIEDFMLLDPFIYHGMAEMHDRHRDMRLDVDNMSCEELLALEEHMGDVKTGLNEEAVSKLMKQEKFVSMTMEPDTNQEPCCICQEEYGDGDDVGTLDCGHEFHTSCIKRWLFEKNLCPICKTTVLGT